jgi:hypothetical protein
MLNIKHNLFDLHLASFFKARGNYIKIQHSTSKNTQEKSKITKVQYSIQIPPSSSFVVVFLDAVVALDEKSIVEHRSHNVVHVPNPSINSKIVDNQISTTLFNR